MNKPPKTIPVGAKGPSKLSFRLHLRIFILDQLVLLKFSVFDAKCQIMTSQRPDVAKYVKLNEFLNFNIKLVSSQSELERGVKC